MSDRLFLEIEKRVKLIQDYVLSEPYVRRFAPEDMKEAVTAYFRSGGKRLRPAVLLFACGAVGGDESKAISAAAAVEIFHTWTLVHDDIIDRDALRRGQPTVHEQFYKKSLENGRFGKDVAGARHYGISVAILAGDVQHGWGISLMTELSTRYGISPEVTLKLIDTLDTYVLTTLVEGELLDVQQSKMPIEALSEADIEDMLWKKTGALYEFCGAAGAAIGLNSADFSHPLVKAISGFTSACGAAFQLQDDILGILGDEKRLGKPVGSDIREGKRTLIVCSAYRKASPAQRELMNRILGNKDASMEEISEVTALLVDLGGVEYTKERAKVYLQKALPYLEKVPPSFYRDLLADWAQLMTQREF
ncbi:MAG: polyprenyl synthetase family protein [Calditrichaeota bacterium]|nr:polyprenyl synthetase family protein [Calditrichota bacterium]